MFDVVLLALVFAIVFTAFCVLCLVLQVGVLMSLSDEVVAAVNELKAGVSAAVADIAALHAKVDGFLEVGDVSAARAALAEVSPALSALAEAVAIPE